MNARGVIEPTELLNTHEIAQLFKMTEAAVRSRVSGGHWVVGVHFYRKGGRLMFDPVAIRKWWMSETQRKAR
jgi:hypothetical protein